MRAFPDFHQVIQFTVRELTELYDAVRPSGHPAARSLESLYGEAILRSLRGDEAAMATLLDEAARVFAGHAEAPHLLRAINLRLEIRRREIPTGSLAHAAALAAEPGRWQAELMLLIGTAYATLGEHGRAQEWFFRSIDPFERDGCRIKAVKARLNVLVAESHLAPQRNLIPAYHDLYRRAMARDVRESSIAATCLLNISREYQRLGACLAALKFCDRALRLLEAHHGSITHHLALVHRAHLLCELGREDEARIDYESALCSEFGEIRAALAVLERALRSPAPAVDPTTDERALLSHWKERRDELDSGEWKSRQRFSPLEDRLVAFLRAAPRDRIDILEHLYGDKLSHEVKLNRFKSLLGTLRRKSPSLIICEKGRYRLADAIYAPKRRGA